MYISNDTIRRSVLLRSFLVLGCSALLYGCSDSSSKSSAPKGHKPGPSTNRVAKAPVPVKAPDPAFYEAALEGSLDVVIAAVKAGVDINAFDDEGRTALMYAAFNAHTEIVGLLLQRGARVDERDPTGRTALMYAATSPVVEPVKLLLDKKANVNLVDSDEHFSALMFAAAEGHVDVVRVLLARGADSTLKDVDGDTASSFAKKSGHAAVVQLLAPSGK